jgi:hypothetical protein
MESRRTFLTGSLAAGTVAVAGCGDILGGSGDDEQPDEDGSGGSDQPEGAGSRGRYADLIAGTDERPVTAIGQKVGRLADIEDFGGINNEEEFLGVAPSDLAYSLDVTVAAETYSMVFGPFDFETVATEYENTSDAEITEAEPYGDFQTLEATLGQNTFYVGVGDGVLVNALERARYEQAIDQVGEGAATLIGSGTELDYITGTLGDPDIVVLELEPDQLQIDPTGEAVAGGAGLDIAQSESGYTAVVGYESAEMASENESGVGDAAVEAEPAVDSVETSVDDRFVIVRGDATTADL